MKENEESQFINWKWVVGILITIVFAGATMWMTKVSNSLDALNNKLPGLESRVSKLEGRADGVDTRFDDVLNSIRRLETKIDRLIER